MANLENNNQNKDKFESEDSLTDFSENTSNSSENNFFDDDKNIKRNRFVKWCIKLILFGFYFVLGLVILFFIVINLPVTKNYLAQQALGFVNKEMGIQISTKDVAVNFFGDVVITGLEIKDQKGFPFLKARELQAEANWFSLIKNTRKLSFQSVILKNADVKVITYKGDSIPNFIWFTDKFDDGKGPDPNKPPFHIDLRIKLLASKVSIVNQNTPGEEGRWLNATNVNALIPRYM